MVLVALLSLVVGMAAGAAVYVSGIRRGYRWARSVPEPGEFEIRKSPIHGLGLFATRRYEPGEYVGMYEGRVDCDVDSIYFQPLGDYAEEGDDEAGEWGIVGDGPLKHMNSSRDPNAEMVDVFAYALKVIEPGDEITLDYWYVDEDEATTDRMVLEGTLEEVSAKLREGGTETGRFSAAKPPGRSVPSAGPPAGSKLKGPW